VSSSNATFGATIFATNSTDLGNNTNWNFGAAAAQTWTGSVNNRWDVGSNWSNFVVPRSIDDVLIGDETNDPQLQSGVTVHSLDIGESLAELDLNNFDLVVTTYVNLSGIITARGTEQITVGGNWTVTGGTFNAAQSTVTFNASGSTQTILSGGTSFYNLLISTGGTTATYKLRDALYTSDNLTVLNGLLDTTPSAYALNVSSSLYLNGGNVTANASPISVGANLIVQPIDGIFSSGSSTVTLTGDGYLRNPNAPNAFFHLVFPTTGRTTTLTGNIRAAGQIKLGDNTTTVNTNGLAIYITSPGRMLSAPPTSNGSNAI
jgi:hypothetical protein